VGMKSRKQHRAINPGACRASQIFSQGRVGVPRTGQPIAFPGMTVAINNHGKSNAVVWFSRLNSLFAILPHIRTRCWWQCPCGSEANGISPRAVCVSVSERLAGLTHQARLTRDNEVALRMYKALGELSPAIHKGSSAAVLSGVLSAPKNVRTPYLSCSRGTPAHRHLPVFVSGPHALFLRHYLWEGHACYASHRIHPLPGRNRHTGFAANAISPIRSSQTQPDRTCCQNTSIPLLSSRIGLCPVLSSASATHRQSGRQE